jgi:hypothetical protein
VDHEKSVVAMTKQLSITYRHTSRKLRAPPIRGCPLKPGIVAIEAQDIARASAPASDQGPTDFVRGPLRGRLVYSFASRYRVANRISIYVRPNWGDTQTALSASEIAYYAWKAMTYHDTRQRRRDQHGHIYRNFRPRPVHRTFRLRA